MEKVLKYIIIVIIIITIIALSINFYVKYSTKKTNYK